MNYNIHLQGNFSFGEFTHEPLLGALFPLDPVEGVTPLYTPLHGGVYILPGCKVFMGYKHDKKKKTSELRR